MTDLPAAVPFATVTAWLTQSVADTADAGSDPDMLAMSGTITFTPNVIRAKVPDAIPQPMTVFPRPILCTLDSEGFLLGPDGARNVTLIATGDLIPSYTVRFDLDGVDRFTLNVLLPEGDEVDLATVLEVPNEPAVELAAWLDAVTRAEAAATAAHTFTPVATAGRPADAADGRTAFDSTLGIPIWRFSGHWVNAAGTTV